MDGAEVVESQAATSAPSPEPVVLAVIAAASTPAAVRPPSPAAPVCPPGEEDPAAGPAAGLRDWSKEQQRSKLPRVLTCADFTTLSWVEDMRNYPRLYYCEPDRPPPRWLQETKSSQRCFFSHYYFIISGAPGRRYVGTTFRRVVVVEQVI